MEAKMKKQIRKIVSIVVALVILLTLTPDSKITFAQGPTGKDPAAPEAIAPGALPIQGKLTDANGNPLNGDFTLTFRLYDVTEGGSPLCADVQVVTIVDGLFNTYMDHCYNGKLTGQRVYLAIQVESDPEMTPRQVILPVAYALGLVPGVVVNASTASVLSLSTSHTTGKALTAAATSATGVNYGIYSSAGSPDGQAGYFYNSSSGIGVSGISVGGTGVNAGSLDTGLRASGGLVAISAEGSGIIKSTAKSYVWISGRGVRPYSANDSTRINMDSIGGAKIYRGTAAGNKNVVLPITITGPLYGQNVKIAAVDIYWVGDSAFEGIVAILMRRQTGVCSTSACYVNILNDRPDGGYSCEDSVNPTGCVQHLVPTANNILTPTSGLLYLTIELTFGGDTWVEIGGVRLTLEHD
jgi:hypothetical protein